MVVLNEKVLTRRRFESPMGPVMITANDEGIVDLNVAGHRDSVESEGTELGAHFAQLACVQLQEYFMGNRTQFNLPLMERGTPFQRSVWNALRDIPYGETKSYRDIASAIGNERAVRAVGQANRANPFPIVVPCHRVIGANGSLVGYAGSHIDLKSYLLDLERSITSAAVQSHA